MFSRCCFLFVSLVFACTLIDDVNAASASASASSSLTPAPAPAPVVVFPAEGCTAMAFGPKSSPDGAMTTHTNDCKDCDFRLSLVPGGKHAESSTRPVPLSRFSYPRYVGNDRGEALKAERVDTTIYAWGPSEPIGSIPQASETYSYIDGTYGIMNEHQVAMGESTCSARLISKPLTQGGEAMFDIAELGRVALERTKTARDAIKLMGSLGETYGYYGAEWEGDYAYAEAGEALTVTDPNEAWVFHILPDDTGKSAVWVAQRVPDDHVAVVANQFTIGEIDLNNTDYFLGSSNIHEVAIRNGFWDPSGDEPFHFSRVYSCHIIYEIYCSRRIWRVYDVFAPSLHLNPNSTVLELPFSIKPDREIKIRDVMNMQRDHYEGTPFDMTRGLAAGPYGNPNRYDRGSVENVPMGILMQGTFERAISLFRTSYSFVSQSRSSLPSPIGGVLWFGESSPHATCYVPFYPASTSLPLIYQTGSLYQYSRDSAWWSFTVVSNWAERMYRYIIKDVQSAQLLAETSQLDQQKSFESHALQVLHENHDIDAVKQMLTSYHTENAQNVFKTWNALFEYLITKYHDGYRLDDFHAVTINPTSLFYPIDWLQSVGFFTHGIDWNHTKYSYTSFPDDARQRHPDLTRTDAPAVHPPNTTHHNDNHDADTSITHAHKSTPPLSDNGYVTGAYISPPSVASSHDNVPSPSLDNAPSIPQRSESQPVTSWGRHINPNQTRPARPPPGILPNATDEVKIPVMTQPHDDVPISPYPYPNYQIPSSPQQAQIPASASASVQSLIAIPTPTTTAPRSLWAFDVLLFAISCLICMMLGIYIGRKWERHEYQEIAEMEPLNGMGHRTWA